MWTEIRAKLGNPQEVKVCFCTACKKSCHGKKVDFTSICLDEWLFFCMVLLAKTNGDQNGNCFQLLLERSRKVPESEQ